MNDMEHLGRLMDSGLALGDIERVKRQADAIFEAGGDPISLLVSVVLQSDPAGLSWKTARMVLGSLDSAVLQALDGSPSLPLVRDERSRRDKIRSKYEERKGLREQPNKEDRKILLRVEGADLAPSSVEEIRVLCLSGSVSAISLARASVVEGKKITPASEQAELQPVILEVLARFHGPTSIGQASAAASQPGLLRRLRCYFGLHLGQHWRFLDEVSCRAVYICDFCGTPFNEHRRHLYGILGYRDGSSCTFGKFCLRCNSFRETEEKHTWGDWAYTYSSSCRQNRVCLRCNKEEARAATHDFVARKLNACITERKCSRCGEEDFLHDHMPGPWAYSSPVSCWASQYCLRCFGEVDIRLMHLWKERQDPETYRYYKRCARCDAEESQ